MNGFFGRHSAKVDDKGRLVIPSAIKGVVSEDQMKFVIRKDMHSDCLEMFTYAEWEAMSQAVGQDSTSLSTTNTSDTGELT